MTKNNYKRLGDFIQRVDVRNTENEDFPLMGVSVQKYFIPSIANTVGTDFKKYKIVERNQFTYIPDTSRRGDKIGVALFDDYEKGLVSQAYTTFEIVDFNKLHPEYLMMWFRRPEFDRYARYHSIGSVREVFDWNDMCDVELPVPSIEKQREIVQEYQAVEKRIALNEEMIAKLEETAQAVYREWFVEFEFPDEDGKPYKSNGGKMVWNEELEKEVPEGWDEVQLGTIMEITSGKPSINKNEIKENEFIYPIFGAGGVMGYSSNFLYNERILSMGRVGTHGVIQRINSPCWTTDNTLVLKTQNYEYVYNILLSINYDEINRGGVQGLITQTDIKEYKILLPIEDILQNFEDMSSKVMNKTEILSLENQKLEELKDLLLTRMVR
ncbi:MAG: restriction endonuclease subunit S [Brumimicrobium sp.]|nr:restriction endonuclease subunit S [Brumimicrobium sp.]